MEKNLLKLFKSGYITIPLILFKIKDQLEISTDSFLILAYLLDKEVKIFNPNKICEALNMSLDKVMECVNELTVKNILNVKVEKNSSGVLEEIINYDLFYSKANNVVKDEAIKEEEDGTDIFQKIELEFGRCLSPMECEVINAWISSGYSEELIKEALKEAIMNGVTSLRYIDKILYEWHKKGFKNKNDVTKNREIYRRNQEIKRTKKEVFDYNWLEDNDE